MAIDIATRWWARRLACLMRKHRSRDGRWMVVVVLASAGLAGSQPLRAAENQLGPPMDVPPSLQERASLESELRNTLPRKYRLDKLTVEPTRGGPGLSIHVRGALTPENQRSRPFKDPHERARSVSRAFLADNPGLFPREGPGVEIVETNVETMEGITVASYEVRIADAKLEDAEAIFFSRNGDLNAVKSLYPLLAQGTVDQIRAAVAEAKVTKDDALAIVENDRQDAKPDARVDSVPYMERLAYPSPPYLRWKIAVTFKDELRQWGYDVDAVTGEVLRRIPPLGEEQPTEPPNLIPPPMPMEPPRH